MIMAIVWSGSVKKKRLNRSLRSNMDRTHTIILMAAIDINKHIYCAKPITYNFNKSRRVWRVISENK